VKLLSTDFDGTLHDDRSQPPVPAELQEVILDLQSRGVTWVINTGRDLPSLSTALAAAQLRISPDFVVVVEREVYRRNSHGLESVESWNLRCRTVHQELFAQVRPLLPDVVRWISSRFQASVFEDAYSPFCLVAANNQDADIIMEYLEGICQQVNGLTIMRNDIYARFCHSDFNKGTALAEIAQLLGVDRESILAAGDHLNDLPMLSYDYAGCLMTTANAVDEVKRHIRQQNGYISHATHGHGVLEGIRFFAHSNR
jgi:hypothetical protein